MEICTEMERRVKMKKEKQMYPTKEMQKMLIQKIDMKIKTQLDTETDFF